ncbi:uncharacterized protein LOC110465068 [Mizuhopecten yessoensis]|uniref:uncharacterized protein LOC110465068 n=1 Tax=Mizuhopecten yessoensis TaxID=6573 RepID=UPI000B45F4F4|nr:uncharacterized protein LOC110465068 [Mizuhopecten yessoensis]
MEPVGISSTHLETIGTQRSQFEASATPSNQLESTGTLHGQYDNLGTANNIETGGISSSHFEGIRTQGSQFETLGTPSNQLESTGTLQGQYENLGTANSIETGGTSSYQHETQSSQLNTIGTNKDPFEATNVQTKQHVSLGSSTVIDAREATPTNIEPNYNIPGVDEQLKGGNSRSINSGSTMMSVDNLSMGTALDNTNTGNQAAMPLQSGNSETAISSHSQGVLSVTSSNLQTEPVVTSVDSLTYQTKPDTGSMSDKLRLSDQDAMTIYTLIKQLIDKAGRPDLVPVLNSIITSGKDIARSKLMKFLDIISSLVTRKQLLTITNIMTSAGDGGNYRTGQLGTDLLSTNMETKADTTGTSSIGNNSNSGGVANQAGSSGSVVTTVTTHFSNQGQSSNGRQTNTDIGPNNILGEVGTGQTNADGLVISGNTHTLETSHSTSTTEVKNPSITGQASLGQNVDVVNTGTSVNNVFRNAGTLTTTTGEHSHMSTETQPVSVGKHYSDTLTLNTVPQDGMSGTSTGIAESTTSIHNAIQSSTSSTSNNVTPVYTADMQSGGSNFMSTETVNMFESSSGVSGSTVVPGIGEPAGMNSRAEGTVNTYDTTGANSKLERGSSSTTFEATHMGIMGSSAPATSESIASSNTASQDIITRSEVPVVANGASSVSENNNVLLQTPDPSTSSASGSDTILESTGAGYVTHGLPQGGGFVAVDALGVEGNNLVVPGTQAAPLNTGLKSDLYTLESFNSNNGLNTIVTSGENTARNTGTRRGSLNISDKVRQSTTLLEKSSSSVSIPLVAGRVSGLNDVHNQGLYTNTETIGNTGEIANANTGSGISHREGSEAIVHSSRTSTDLDAVSSPVNSNQVFDTASLTEMTSQFAAGSTSLAGAGTDAGNKNLGDSSLIGVGDSTLIQTGSPIDSRITLTETESKSTGGTWESGAPTLTETASKQNSGSTIVGTGIPTQREAVGSLISGSTINEAGTQKQMTSAGSASLKSQKGSAARNFREIHSSPSNFGKGVLDTLANGNAVMQKHNLFTGYNDGMVDINTNMLEFVPKHNAFTTSNLISVKTLPSTGNTISNAGSSLMPGHNIDGFQTGIETDIHTHTPETVPTGPFTEGSSLSTTGQFNAISTQTETGSQLNGGSTLTDTGNQFTGGSVLTDTGSHFSGGSTLTATGGKLHSESKPAETGNQHNSRSTLAETGRQLDSGLTQINTGGRFNQDSTLTGSQLSLTGTADQSTGRLNDVSTLIQTGGQLTEGSTLYVAGGQIHGESTKAGTGGQIYTGSTLAETGRLNGGSAPSETGSQIDGISTLTEAGSLSTGGSKLTETGSGFNARSTHTESGGQIAGGSTGNEAKSEFAGSSLSTGLGGQTERISSLAGPENSAVTGPGGYFSGSSTLTEVLAGQHPGRSIRDRVKGQHSGEVAITGVNASAGSADRTSGVSTLTEVKEQFNGSFDTPSILKTNEKSTGHSGISSLVGGGRIGTNTVLGSEAQNIGGLNKQYEHLGGSGADTKATLFTGTFPNPSLNAIGSDFGTSNIMSNSQTSSSNVNREHLLGNNILASEGIRQNTETSFMPHQEPHNAVNSNTRVITRTSKTFSSRTQNPSSFSVLPPPPHSFLIPAPVHDLLLKTQRPSTRSSSPLSFDQMSSGSSVGNTLERAIKRTSTGSTPITNTRVTTTSTRSFQPNWSENALGSGIQASSHDSKKRTGTIRSSSSSLGNTASSSLPQKNANSLWDFSKDLISRRQLLSNAKALASIGLLRGGATDINSILNSLSGIGSSNTLLSRTAFNTQPAETAIALDSPMSVTSLVMSRANRFNSPARSTAEQRRLENILNGRMTTNIPSLSYSVVSQSPNEIVKTTKHTSTSLTSSSLPPISSGLNSVISSIMRNGPGIPAQHLQRANGVQLGSNFGLSGSKTRSAGKSTTSSDGKIQLSGIGPGNSIGNLLQLDGNQNNAKAVNTLVGSSSNLITSRKNNENIIRSGVNNGIFFNSGSGNRKVDITSTMNGNSGGGNTDVVTIGKEAITEVAKQATVNGATTKTRTTQTRDGGTGGIRSSTSTVTTRTTNSPGSAAFHKGGTLASNGVSSNGFRSTTSSTTIISGRESQSVCPGQSLMCGAKGPFSNTIGSNLWCINSCLIDRRMCRSEKCECSCTPTMRYYQQVVGVPGSSSSGTMWNNGGRTLTTSSSYQTQKPFGKVTTFGKSSSTAKPFGSVQTVETFKTTKSFGNTKLSDSRNGFGNGFSGSNVLSGSRGGSNSVRNVSPSGSSDRGRGTSGVQTDTGLMKCKGRGAFETVTGMVSWCETECSASMNINCHSNTCKCWFVT